MAMSLTETVGGVMKNSGQSLIEYLIIVALIAIGSIGVMRSVGESVYVRFANIAGALQQKNVDLQPTPVSPDQFQKRGLDDFFKSASAGNGPVFH